MGSAETWVGLKDLIAKQEPEKVECLVEGQLRLLELMAQPRRLTPVLEELVQVLETQIPDMVAAVALLSEDGKRLRLGAGPSLPEACARALDGSAVGPQAGWCGRSAHLRRPVIVADLETDPVWLEYRHPALADGIRACWSVPIISTAGEVLGTLALLHRRPTAPSSIHLGLITFGTALARIAIERDRADGERERLIDAERFTERYRMVLRATREAVWDWDVRNDVLLWNDGLHALGYDGSNVGGQIEWWLQRIHPGDSDRVRQSWDRVLSDAQSTTWEDEYQFRRSDGSYAQVADRALIARDREGRPVRMVGSLQDITRRKLQALEIQQLAERLRAATAAANVGTWQLDVTANLFHSDASLNRMLGREVRDTIEPLEEALRCVHPDDRADLKAAREDALAGLRPFSVEHRVVLEGGGIRWFRSRGRIHLDRRGTPHNIIGAVADITDLKNSEQSMALLANAARLLAESLDTAQIVTAIVRMAVPTFADGALVHLKQAETGEAELAGAYAADGELNTLLDEIHRSRSFHVGAPAHRVMRTGRPELHAVTAEWLTSEDVDERLIPLVRRFRVSSAVAVPITLDGVSIGVIVFFSAEPRRFNGAHLSFAEELARRASHAMHNAQLLLTAKRERARAEEAQELRERLLAIVGHDLRNPLSAILAASDILRHRDLGPRENAVINRVASSALRMSRLIGQVLDFARIRQGMSLPIEPRLTDLHEICRAVVDELRFGQPNRELRLVTDGHGEAMCDADRIAEALSNLVGNAIQHGAAGPVTVSVRDATDETLAVDIHNLGSIPSEAQATIFEAYRREPSAGDDQRTKSVGLGLFIANEIVKAHQGLIGLSSTAEEGTTFTVLLPRRPKGTTGSSNTHRGNGGPSLV